MGKKVFTGFRFYKNRYFKRDKHKWERGETWCFYIENQIGHVVCNRIVKLKEISNVIVFVFISSNTNTVHRSIQFSRANGPVIRQESSCRRLSKEKVWENSNIEFGSEKKITNKYSKKCW